MPDSAPATPRRTQQERSATTRHAILEAAADCLVEGGLDGVTIAKVSKAAGMSSGALHHHFANKLQLILALTTYLSDASKDAVVLSADPELSPQERVERMIQTLFTALFDPRTRAQFELHTASRTDPALAEELLLLNIKNADGYVVELAQVFGDAPVPEERKRALMELAVSSVAGLSLISISGSDPAIEKRHADTLCALILAEIEAANESAG